MHGAAIAAEPLARDGLGLLTRDFGATRLAEIARMERDPGALEAQGDADEGAPPLATTHATRP